MTDTAFPPWASQEHQCGTPPEPEVRDRVGGKVKQAQEYVKTPGQVCPGGGHHGGQQLKSCREGTFWKWSQALLTSLVPKLAGGGTRDSALSFSAHPLGWLEY